ncbi:hypothetical protein SNK05_013051 [Fusarium graminearum]
MVAINRLVSVLSLCFGTSAAFSIYNATDLESKNVNDACVKAMSANINCPAYIRSFSQKSYHGSLGNTTLTAEICTSTCSASLRNWFNTVSSACANEKIANGVPQFYGGFIWAGWNETCIKDPRTKRYCNDIIDEFKELEEGKERPRDELCHICYLRKLERMQASSYSAYNYFYQSELEKVYKTCGGSGPTEIPPPPIAEEKRKRFCLTKNYYMTKANDTCDSIAKANPGVAGVFLYMGNQELITDCNEIPAGIKLCLPSTCPVHVVRPDDTCWSIEQENDLRIDDVAYFNSWIRDDCSNLRKGTAFYGKPICIGAFGADEPGSWQASVFRAQDPSDSGPGIQFTTSNGPVPKSEAENE